MVIEMSIYNMKMTGGSYDALAYTAPDGSQRFGREAIAKRTSEDTEFGTVMTGDELQLWIDDEISRNQDRKKTLADMIKDSCPGWSTGRFKFAGEAKTYSYYEFLEEMEKYSAVSLSGEKGMPVSEKRSVSEGKPVSEEQIALLFEDRETVDKTLKER